MGTLAKRDNKRLLISYLVARRMQERGNERSRGDVTRTRVCVCVLFFYVAAREDIPACTLVRTMRGCTR